MGARVPHPLGYDVVPAVLANRSPIELKLRIEAIPPRFVNGAMEIDAEVQKSSFIDRCVAH